MMRGNAQQLRGGQQQLRGRALQGGIVMGGKNVRGRGQMMPAGGRGMMRGAAQQQMRGSPRMRQQIQNQQQG